MIKDILINNKSNDNVAVIYSDKIYRYYWIYENVLAHKDNILGTSGENIGLFIQNSIDYVVAYFAISFEDKVIVPIETNGKAWQILSTVDYCELDLIVTNEDNFTYITQILENQAEYDIEIYNLSTSSKKYISKKQKRIHSSGSQTHSEDAVAIMLHTSGTTSNPKKVMLTHKNLISNIQSNVASLKLSSEDRSLIVLPMCFGYCNTSQFLSHFYLGASIVIYDGIFVPKRFFLFIDKYQCTNTTCIPTMLYLIIKSAKNECLLNSLRFICFGGGPVRLEILRTLKELYPNIGMIQTYGQTEASPRVTCLLPEDGGNNKLGSVGKAIPGVCVKIVDKNSNEVPANTKGEIIVKGDNVMKGYYKRPEETKKVIKDDWLYTGDLGMIDADGYLYVVGRIKNVIITGGLNVYPEEIEKILCEYPDVKEAIVFPKPHDVLGEVPIAKVVAKEGKTIDVGKLFQYCKARMENQKLPSEIAVVQKLEKTYNGKIRRSSDECKK